MSGAFDDEVLEVGTEGCLKKSEGLEEGGGREGVGESPANCLGGGILGGGVGEGVVIAVVTTGGVQTPL